MNYYISDLHILHKNVCGEGNNFDNRPFETMKEMMEYIKYHWNKKITNADDVYILGDMCWKENEEAIQFVSTLKGKKHLILGNHDRCKDGRYAQQFVEIVPYKEVKEFINGKQYRLILSHYPIMFWNHQHRLKDNVLVNIHLYGHLHNSQEEAIYQSFIQALNNEYDIECIARNVGCMMPYIHYEPRQIQEILSF
ncbi:metallophosphoesterase [Massilimicrobiota timonensis]|uniref:metallophosphoesterase n=1 Tax=Massilimicrobiota timonensis TaxID=1776392 RepID=UPI00101DB3A7|nr:metallophosphoesterase [Massilimicrobiota timonensis]